MAEEMAQNPALGSVRILAVYVAWLLAHGTAYVTSCILVRVDFRFRAPLKVQARRLRDENRDCCSYISGHNKDITVSDVHLSPPPRRPRPG